MVTTADNEEVVSFRSRDTETERPLPPFPTKHLPGSLGKIIVMEWRWENKFHIHHPNDAKFSDNPEIEDRQIRRDFGNRPIHFDSKRHDSRSIAQKLLDELSGIEWDIESEEE